MAAKRFYRSKGAWRPGGRTVDDGCAYEFDYAGKDVVAPSGDLRGLGGRTPGYIGEPQGSQKLGATMEAFVERLQDRAGSGPSAAARALRVWRQGMGDRRLRLHVQGLFLRQNRVSRELVAYVDAALWAHEFQMFAPAYLREWNCLCASEGLDMKADKLTFRLPARSRRPVVPEGAAPAGAKTPARAPVPLTAEERAEVERTVSAIADERVRQKAYDAMKSVWEWEKSQQGPNDA